MPPTVQTSSRDDRRNRGTGEKRSELVCKVRYNNTLPDIPFDPKFITYPFDGNRFVHYKPTSIERNYKFDLLTEHDLGVNIDLINPDTYKVDPNAYLDNEDEKLLEDDTNAPQDAKKSRHWDKTASWLRRTEYISTEYNRFQQNSSMAEAKVGFNIKKYLKEDSMYKDRESQVKAIEDTFAEAKVPIERHYSKPNVYPVEVSPVYPDFELWKYPCAQVIFDADPAPPGRPVSTQVEEMSQAMIKGMVDDAGDQFVAYFLPTDDTVEKRRRDVDSGVDYDDSEEYEYTLVREYNWNVKNKLSKGYEETYFFVFKPEGVYYNELETRVRLSKRRKMGGGPPTKSRLIVRHREIDQQEIGMQEARLSMLEVQAEEEEEEEMHVEEDTVLRSGDEEEGEKEEAEKEEAEKSGAEEEEEEEAGSPAPARRRRRISSGSGSEKEGSFKSLSANSKSGSGSGSGSDSGSGSGSDSGSEAEDEVQKKQKAAAEIFGSDSDSDSD